MDDIRQEKPNEGPILSINKKNYGSVLARNLTHNLRNLSSWKPLKNDKSPIINELSLEIKLLAKLYLPKVKDIMIQKIASISIRHLTYCQRFHCWLNVETLLVCQPKNKGIFGPKETSE